MQAVIHHLLTPQVEQAVALITALTPGGCRIPSTYARDARRASKLLVARARYRHAGCTDIDAAIDDLLADFTLAGICCNSGDQVLIIIGIACEELAHAEIQRMAFERHLSRRQARRINDAIQTTLPGAETLWDNVVTAEVDTLNRTLDLAYSKDADGNGWLVLSRLDDTVWQPRRAPQTRIGAWNILSPLFNNRQVVAAKIERIRSALAEVPSLPFDEAQARMEALKAHAPLNILDGPMWKVSATQTAPYLHRSYIYQLAWRRVTSAAVALAAYRTDHGIYPRSLQELDGDYLEHVPADPFDGKALRYFPKPAEDDFLLYCVGNNLIDDGGARPSATPPGRPRPDDGDVLFDHIRRTQLYSEIALDRAKP